MVHREILGRQEGIGTTIPSSVDDGQTSYLNGKIELGKVLEDPIDDTLDIVFSQKLGNRLNLQQGSVLVGHQSILRKVVGEAIYNVFSQLFFLFGKITPPNDADGNLLGQGHHKVHHVIGDFPPRDGKRPIDVKERNDPGILRSRRHVLLLDTGR